MAFEVGPYDPSRALVIDPVYSTYLGGSELDQAQGIAVDAMGNAFVTGFTQSTVFPQATNAYKGGAADAFVTKISAFGSLGPVFLYSTYLGGSGDDEAEAIALDSAGNAFVAGFTNSTDFSTMSPLQASLLGTSNAFVAKINGSSGAPVYSTYLGGDGADVANGIAVDTSGDAFVAGNTSSANFPTMTPFQPVLAGSQNAFVSEMNPAGSALVYSSFLGGSFFDAAQGIALDGAGEAFVTGSTFSSDFPVSLSPAPYQGNLIGTQSAFVTKLNALGSMAYSTYLGGELVDMGQAIAADVAGDAAFIAGATSSTKFPTTPGAFQPMLAGSQNAFVTKLSVSGSSLVYSTYLGGNGTDQANAIALDFLGIAYVAGFTSSTNFPTVGAIDTQLAGAQDAFFTELNINGSPTFSTYVGGSDSDQANAIAVDAASHAYVAGLTTSTDFFPAPSGPSRTYGGNGDAFVAVFALPTPLAPALGPWRFGLATILLWIGFRVIERKRSSGTGRVLKSKQPA